MILDELEDPHNLGAILRSVDAVGAHGVIIPKRRAVPLTDGVAKASAGAIEHVPVGSGEQCGAGDKGTAKAGYLDCGGRYARPISA